MRARAGGTLLAALALAPGAGCRAWHTVPLAAGEARPLPTPARVVLSTGRRVEFATGRVTADSVVGAAHAGGSNAQAVLVALPRDSVVRVEQRRVSWLRVIVITGASIGLVMVALQAAAGTKY